MHELSMAQGIINAVIDTFVEASNASKTAYDKYKKTYCKYTRILYAGVWT